ncbi:MAG: acetyl-CoA carboxylase biotin carboxyl carrier protein [Alphaproteobacteria bacterium]|nr:acetyl-CoA carboxylase biotin carboxyl carrier protein [Alphaproteobacteria bacterium]
MSLAPQVKIDPEAVRALAELLRETDLTEIEYQVDSLRIKVLRTVPQAVIPVAAPVASPLVSQSVTQSAEPQQSTAESLENHPGVIEAQMVGTVYLSPGPGAEPFVTVGSTVSQGQTLFIIEAMKVMNMIKAPRSGVIKHIFVKDAQPVEYGDPVLIIE